MLVKQIEGYRLLMDKLLGQGTFGQVYLAINDKTKQKVAVKMITKSKINDSQYLRNTLFSEINIMKGLKSQNIVRFVDVLQSTNYYYIIQQLCDGDLFETLKKRKTIPQDQAKLMLRQITNGFLTLVGQGIMHRDLKPANIMHKGDLLKICDFGLSKQIQASSAQYHSITGTPLYMSLQILKGQAYSSKCDIWALGFIYYEMLHGHPPWIAKSQYLLAQNIKNKSLEIKKDISLQSHNFLKKTLQIYEKDRLCWDQVFFHQIFQGYFIKKTQGSKKIEDKLKMLMSDCRYQINFNNLNVYALFKEYSKGKQQLQIQVFYKFMKRIYQNISQQQVKYLFQQADTSKTGKVSLKQIEQIMQNHNITMNQVQNSPQQSTNIEQQLTEILLKDIFKKLFKYLQKCNMTLYDIYLKFCADKDIGLTKSEYKKMMSQISKIGKKDINEEEIQKSYHIFIDNKKYQVTYSKLNECFSKANNLPVYLNEHKQKVTNQAAGISIFQAMLTHKINHHQSQRKSFNQTSFNGNNQSPIKEDQLSSFQPNFLGNNFTNNFLQRKRKKSRS